MEPENYTIKFGPAVSQKELAERVGFEPTIPVKVCPLSRRIVSTTHAPLRMEKAVRCRLSGILVLGKLSGGV